MSGMRFLVTGVIHQVVVIGLTAASRTALSLKSHVSRAIPVTVFWGNSMCKDHVWHLEPCEWGGSRCGFSCRQTHVQGSYSTLAGQHARHRFTAYFSPTQTNFRAYWKASTPAVLQSLWLPLAKLAATVEGRAPGSCDWVDSCRHP